MALNPQGMIGNIIMHKYMMSFVPKILVDSDRHKFGMTQNAQVVIDGGFYAVVEVVE